MKASGIMAVQISIDGAEAQTHDWFRGEEGAFNKALEGARACREVGLPFQFGMTIRRGTLDEIPAMLKLAVDSGAIAAEFFDLIQVPRVKREIPDEVLTPDERKEVMEWLAEAQTECPIIIRVPGCPMYTLAAGSILTRTRKSTEKCRLAIQNWNKYRETYILSSEEELDETKQKKETNKPSILFENLERTMKTNYL